MIAQILKHLTDKNYKVEIINDWEYEEEDRYWIRIFKRGEYSKETADYDHTYVGCAFGDTIEDAFDVLIKKALGELYPDDEGFGE